MILQNYMDSKSGKEADILLKQSPLSEVYRKQGAVCLKESGWNIAGNFGKRYREEKCLATGSLLVDWSHIGKISVRGIGAEEEIAKIDSKAGKMQILTAVGSESLAILRLTKDEFILLTKPGEEAEIIDQLDADKLSVLNYGGGMGCLVLAGINRDEVIERSSAMNLRRDKVPQGSVIQTTMHMVHCTLLRTADYDIFLHTREYSVSLFDALMDVGIGVGLLPSGIEVVPVNFKLGS